MEGQLVSYPALRLAVYGWLRYTLGAKYAMIVSGPKRRYTQ
jgi:hypothetical protein